MIAALILIICACALIFGLPVYLVLGSAAFTLFWVSGMPLVSLVQTILDHINSISFMAIPFFMVTATFMERGGVASALVRCANAWVGHLRGGLAVVCVVCTMLFGAISGSSVATALAMGTLLIPAMIEKNYERKFATGLVGTAGTLGILIPPSMAFIVFAIIAEESIPRLFLAGIVPGLLQAFILALWSLGYSRYKGFPVSEKVVSEEFWKSNKQALPALILPVVIIGGIYGGIVTVTEAAALSAVLSISMSVFVYKGCSFREVPIVLVEAFKRSATIIFIIMMAIAFSHWITHTGLATKLVAYVMSAEVEAWFFLIIINLVMILLGLVIENFAVVLIIVPIVLPLLGPLGIDPVHFAVVLTVNLGLGVLTPPVGLNLFVLQSVTKAPMKEIISGIIPFIFLMLIFLVIVTYVPAISLWLPNLVMG